MNRNGILNKLARARTVEAMVLKIAHVKRLDGDLQDLSQMVYATLCEKPATLIEGLDRRHELNFFISKIITNLLFSKTSRFYYQYVLPRKREVSIECNKTENATNEP